MKSLIFIIGFFVGCYSSEWTQFGFDASRTGYNTDENILSSLISSSQSFMLQWNLDILGGSLSQPLYVQGVNIEGYLIDMLYIATESGNFFGIHYLLFLKIFHFFPLKFYFFKVMIKIIPKKIYFSYMNEYCSG